MGCEQSVPVEAKELTTIGQSERRVSRAVRLQEQKQLEAQQQKLDNNNGTPTTKKNNASGGGGGSDSTHSISNMSRHNDNRSSHSTTDAAQLPKVPPKLNENGHLMPEEIVKRTDCGMVTKQVVLGSPQYPIIVDYAHWTQRGYYPDAPHKENQDEWSITFPTGIAKTTTALEKKNSTIEADDGSSTTEQQQQEEAALEAYFAVYDGHGAEGHSCARYVRDHLPRLLTKHVKKARVKKYQEELNKNDKSSSRTKVVKLYDPAKWPVLDPAEYEACCKKAYLECNLDMEKDKKIRDKLSGTTAISVCFHGPFITVSNVGDSRAVIGHQVSRNDPSLNRSSSNGGNITTTPSEEEKVEERPEQHPENNITTKQEEGDNLLLAIPLSRDQTPYRKDERERVKKYGASIMSTDQMEGLEEMHENWGDMVLGEDVDLMGDPPRVWAGPDKNYPGTAFTRSLGDTVAKSVGVTADPELLSKELTVNDKILVIASDGIFEFLTNQKVIDLCADCENPLQACEKLVKAAYEQWIVYEKRTDDITVIVCFLKCTRPPPSPPTSSSSQDNPSLSSSEEKKEQESEQQQQQPTGTTEDLVHLAGSMYGSKPVRKKARGKHDNLSMNEAKFVEAFDAEET